ncbi:hypothetical protein BpHYR1_008343 [Brachionus plicatilis]|uniref:Uncharacterized protein n=1 Tax=Brachionus plicatilis TaxID=10195 RepID=A0A3M7SCY5_BRAPC|nr:hypothetical protein BpHYR1_008343 [Brachionus plicatilis]
MNGVYKHSYPSFEPLILWHKKQLIWDLNDGNLSNLRKYTLKESILLSKGIIQKNSKKIANSVSLEELHTLLAARCEAKNSAFCSKMHAIKNILQRDLIKYYSKLSLVKLKDNKAILKLIIYLKRAHARTENK